MNADVVIIGAGAVGTAIARELSKFNLEVILLDKNEDVGGDASKSNSAIIHTGYDAKPGTLESRLVVAANPMYDKLVKDLDIPFKKTGAILVATTEEEYGLLPGIKKKSYDNGVYDIELLTSEKVLEMEPQVTKEVKGGLYIPRESIVDPFLMVVALGENAAANGVKVLLSTRVVGIEVEGKKVSKIVTDKGEITAKFVINAAGLHCDDIAKMVDSCDFTVHPRKGQFYILDNSAPYKLNKIILPVPTKHTKGKLASPTIHGNILIGPTAEDLDDKEDKSVTREGLKEVIDGVKKLAPNVSARDAITEYCGLRPTRTPEGYFIGTSEEVKGYIGVTGIRSTGLTASISIAKYVVDILDNEGLELKLKNNFNPYRVGIIKFSEASTEEKEKLIKENPLYANIICRCETVTEGEIIEAIRRDVGAKSLDGIKRRLRAGMGRCQGGFCSPRIMEILARELNTSIYEITKQGKGSEVLIAPNR